MVKINHKDAFGKLIVLENTKLLGKSSKDVFSKALITHWLQGDVPNSLLSKEKHQAWCDCLGVRKKPIISFDTLPFPPSAKSKFNFIDLFAGIGGFRIALQELGGKCVFSSEWNLASQQTYYNNFGEFPFGDIREFTADHISDARLIELIPDHDILAAGFPCQPFSHAGVSARSSIGQSHGFECKTQGTLFFDICRIVKAKKPRVLLLENVKNLKRHDSGKTFQAITESILELGYEFYSEIIDSSSVVPQRRERCYMVCLRNDIKSNFSFPVISGTPLSLKDILQENVDEKYTISDRLWLGHINRSARNVARGTGFTAYTVEINKPSNTLVARYGKDGKECLIPQSNKNPRLLTPRECARLQGFPEKFIIPESRTPAYQQFGNSVVVPVVKLIADAILCQTNLLRIKS